MNIALYAMFALGCWICGFNFFVSFLRYPFYKLRGREHEYRWESGVPLLGSALVLFAIFTLREPIWIVVVGLAVAVTDTGGIHWLLATMLLHTLNDLCGRAAKTRH